MRIFDAAFVWVACVAVGAAELSAARRGRSTRLRAVAVLLLVAAATAFVVREGARLTW